MRREIKVSLMLALVVMIGGFLFYQCVPPEATEPTQGAAQESSETSKEDSLKNATCLRYLSFAFSYYSNQNWASAIKNFYKLEDLGCNETPDHAKRMYYYWGKCYLNLSKNDSALFIFQKGLKYLPDDMTLLKNIAYVYRLKNDLNGQITTLERIVELVPEDIEQWQELAKLYFKADRPRDQLWAVNKILEIDPENEQAKQDLVLIYERLGKDPITVIKEQWEANPSNVRYGLDYAQALYDRSEYNKVINVCRQIITRDNKNIQALSLLAESYEYTEQYSQAINTYVRLYNLKRDINYINRIVDNYLTIGDFKMAYNWADKGVQQFNSALAYKLRGRVYYEAASQCTAQKEGTDLSFSDKLVYLMAYEDYKKAQELGDRTLDKKVDYLKQYLIPTKGDWFMQDATKKVFRPEGNCYNWIDRTMKNPFAG